MKHQISVTFDDATGALSINGMGMRRLKLARGAISMQRPAVPDLDATRDGLPADSFCRLKPGNFFSITISGHQAMPIKKRAAKRKRATGK